MRIQQSLIVASLLLVGSTVAAQTPARVGMPSLAVQQDRLASRFQPLVQRAVAPAATRADREALVKFLSAEVLPYLAHEGSIVYPLVDSLWGSQGYATVSATFAQGAITSTVNQMRALAGSNKATSFVGEANAAAGLLAAYFQQEESLIHPLLQTRLSRSAMMAVIAQVDAYSSAGLAAAGLEAQLGLDARP